jgi:hypothetical protein
MTTCYTGEIADDSTVNVQRKSTGIWKILGGSRSDDVPPPYTEEPMPLAADKRKNSSDEKDRSMPPLKQRSRQATLDEKAKPADAPTGRPSPPRRMTSWLSRKSSTCVVEAELVEEPVMIEYLPAPTRSSSSWLGSPWNTPASTPASTPAGTPAGTPAQTPGEGAPQACIVFRFTNTDPRTLFAPQRCP